MAARASPARPLALPERGALLALAERALEQALAAGADEAEVFVQEGRSLTCDIERNMVEGASAGGDFGIGLRVVKARRLGFGYASEPGRAKRAAEAALQAASLAPRGALRFAEPAPAPAVQAPDPRILDLEPEALAARCKAIIEAARAVHEGIDVSGGGVGGGSEAWALANSRGLRHEERAAGVGASASAVLKDGALSTGGEHQSRRDDDLDLQHIGRRAAQLAVQGRKPKALASGAYTLLMKPDAMQELLEFCCLRGLVGENLRRKESPFVGKLGKRVAWKGLSLHDDGLLPGGLGTSQRDDEGLPCRRTPLIEAGVARGALYDLRSAREGKAQPTASATRAERGDGERSYRAPPRTGGRNFVVSGPSEPLADLVASTKRGLVVHDVIGAHTANPTTGEFHVASSQLFLVERGEVKGPVKSAMISGSMLDWLRRTTGLSRETEDLDGYSSPAALRLPWFRVEGVQVHA